MHVPSKLVSKLYFLWVARSFCLFVSHERYQIWTNLKYMPNTYDYRLAQAGPCCGCMGYNYSDFDRPPPQREITIVWRWFFKEEALAYKPWAMLNKTDIWFRSSSCLRTSFVQFSECRKQILLWGGSRKFPYVKLWMFVAMLERTPLGAVVPDVTGKEIWNHGFIQHELLQVAFFTIHLYIFIPSFNLSSIAIECEWFLEHISSLQCVCPRYSIPKKVRCWWRFRQCGDHL